VDAAGARALARRIAEGGPADDRAGATLDDPPAPAAGGVVYVRPVKLRPKGELRVFVRGPDGHLHRTR
jgi:hypothetical protein